MVNSWIPIEDYIIKFNQPAWSVSTEFFFYLCFPFLIYRLTNNWYLKLFGALALAASIIMLCDKLHLLSTNNYHLSQLSLVYYTPPCRLFEFILGMSTAVLYRKIQAVKLNIIIGSFFEISLIWLMILSFSQFHLINADPYQAIKGTASIWMTLSGGSSPFIALVILTLALEKGIVSKAMRFPLLVSLGEISYSLYLVHNIFLSYYSVHTADYQDMSLLLRSCLYWTTIFTTAYLMWRFIEIPMRRFITNFSFKSKTKVFNENDAIPVTLNNT